MQPNWRKKKVNKHTYKKKRDRAQRILLPFLPCGDTASRQQSMDQKVTLTWHWICLLDLTIPCQAWGSLTPRHAWMMAWIISSPPDFFTATPGSLWTLYMRTRPLSSCCNQLIMKKRTWEKSKFKMPTLSFSAVGNLSKYSTFFSFGFSICIIWIMMWKENKKWSQYC